MHQTADDIQSIYREIHRKLVEPFPQGTMEGRENHAKYIPVQPYIYRLEEAAGMHWSWCTVGEPMFFDKEDQVMVKGLLKICDSEREGIGFSNFQRFPDTGKIKNLKYSILSAASDALRDACDKYEMGWADLSEHREWGKNPGVGSFMQKSGSTSEGKNENELKIVCLKCQNPLSEEDKQMVKELQLKHPYCLEHIPNHLKK